MNKNIIGKIFPEKLALINLGHCPVCEKQIKLADFKNEISKREFEISGLCQKCQDETFGE
jgi:hypothetical protein